MVVNDPKKMYSNLCCINHLAKPSTDRLGVKLVCYNAQKVIFWEADALPEKKALWRLPYAKSLSEEAE